jgi:hypothetical protein
MIKTSRNSYVLERSTTMRIFNYYSVPTILQNFDNINFNICLHNKYYVPQLHPDQRPKTINVVNKGELQQIIKWGIKIMQTNTTALMNDPTYTPIVFSTLEAKDELLENNAEECYFATKDLRWNINDKRIYRVSPNNTN